MSEPVVEVRGLCKQFGGVDAVRDLSFDILSGQVVGFIGANGAGKTTTMRMIATLETPTRGSVRVCGEDNLWRPAHARARLGWMPDRFTTYSLVSVREYVDFFARAHGLAGAERERRVDEILAFTDLASISDRHTQELSTGMKQRLSLARALIHDPALLILDEPAAGLDPAARVGFKEMVRRLAADGRTLFISSHILSELAEMCDELILIDKGRIVHRGSAESLDVAAESLVRVEVLEPPGELEDWLSMQPGVQLVELHKRGASLRLERDDDESAAELLRRMIQSGFSVVRYGAERSTLEHAFIARLRSLGEQDATDHE